MTHPQTAAYPPRRTPPLADTHADTLIAESAAGPESARDTLLDEGAASGGTSGTSAGVRGGAPGSIVVPPRGHTVLPEVRTDGPDLVVVPRQEARYESAHLLGRGGMGEVKLAHDQDIGRKVALKRLLGQENPQAVARFIDEVRTVGSLEHPNIVPIHDVGVDEDGSLFFVMKYVEGETVADVITKLREGDGEYHRRYSFERRLDLFAGLMRALQYAHARGLVHRDIKPENVMVGQFGEVILMDWGIAHRMRSEDPLAGSGGAVVGTFDRASTETVDGAVIGTPQYMSPEQASGEVAELDGRSDIYSAFALLFELLTLEPYVPAGKSPVQTLLAVQERQFPSAYDGVFEASPHQDPVWSELRHFMAAGLRPSKDDRFVDAAEVLWELGRVRSGDFDVHCPVTFMKHNNTKMERFMERHTMASFVFAGFTALVFLGGVAGWVAWAMSAL